MSFPCLPDPSNRDIQMSINRSTASSIIVSRVNNDEKKHCIRFIPTKRTSSFEESPFLVFLAHSFIREFALNSVSQSLVFDATPS